MSAKLLPFTTAQDKTTSSTLFEIQSELLTPDKTAELLHTTRGTVYQWHSRPKRYGVPEGLFIKLGRKLLVRREILKAWVLSRSS